MHHDTVAYAGQGKTNDGAAVLHVKKRPLRGRKTRIDDLISRKALLKEMNAYKFDTVNDTARRTEHAVKAHMFDLVERQPAVSGFKNVIEQLEEKEKSARTEEEIYKRGGVPVMANVHEAEADAYRDSIRIIQSYMGQGPEIFSADLTSEEE